MIPIAKNIIVVDEQGNEYEATYPKRAKGLVKNGRARFVSNNTICFVCPPNILEDEEMNDINVENAAEIKESAEVQTEVSMQYVLSRIDSILKDTAYIHEAIGAILNMQTVEPTEGMPSYQGDFAGKAKAEAISHTVQCRETTNQQLIRLLEKMYDDLKPKVGTEELSEEILKFRELADSLCKYPKEAAVEIMKEAIRCGCF